MRSGNGYDGRQWFYWLINIPLIFVIKQGITRDRLLSRWREIDSDSIGWDFPIMIPVKVRFANKIEKAFKRITRRGKTWKTSGALWFLRVTWFKGDGKTERFYLPMLILSIPVVLIAFIIEWLIYFGGATLFFYLLNEMNNGEDLQIRHDRWQHEQHWDSVREFIDRFR